MLDLATLATDISPASPEPADDYDQVRRILAFLSQNWREQPSIEAISDHIGCSATQTHHLFRRWAGLTPKAFLQALTLDHAKTMLAASASVLDTAHEVGLSGPRSAARSVRDA